METFYNLYDTDEFVPFAGFECEPLCHIISSETGEIRCYDLRLYDFRIDCYFLDIIIIQIWGENA